MSGAAVSLSEIFPERVPSATPEHGPRCASWPPKESAPEGAQSTGVEKT
jgi:hypothetical protein